MILGAAAIRQAVANKEILISPFTEEQLNPGSYDIRLSRELLINRRASDLHHRRWWKPGFWHYCIDLASKHEYETITIPPGGIILYPGITYLGGGLEVFKSDKFIGCYDGKSSLGRSGVFSHVTAGYIDNGFHGQITLELVVVQPTRVYANMRIGQIRFHQIEGPDILYRDVGHYVGGPYSKEAAHPAPTAPKVYLQIAKDRALGRMLP